MDTWDLLATVTSTAINMHICTSLSPSGYISKTGVAESYDNSVFEFLSN